MTYLAGESPRARLAQKIMEDDPRWNPRTMGNRRAGPRPLTQMSPLEVLRYRQRVRPVGTSPHRVEVT